MHGDVQPHNICNQYDVSCPRVTCLVPRPHHDNWPPKVVLHMVDVVLAGFCLALDIIPPYQVGLILKAPTYIRPAQYTRKCCHYACIRWRPYLDETPNPGE
eukprot:365252-Chlamydomonas_euryale.AAC.43